MDKLEVEVVGATGALYKALVTDVFENEVQVVFENDWQPERKYKFNLIKLPPKPDSNCKFVEGQKVEVFASFQEQEPKGWYKGICYFRRRHKVGSSKELIEYD
ncbi:hypothetical protein ACFE04_019769 [Oxalis oulophora]